MFNENSPRKLREYRPPAPAPAATSTDIRQISIRVKVGLLDPEMGITRHERAGFALDAVIHTRIVFRLPASDILPIHMIVPKESTPACLGSQANRQTIDKQTSGQAPEKTTASQSPVFSHSVPRA